MYKFHYDYIKNKYGNDSRLLFTGSDSLIYETKMKISMNILAAIKKCLILVIIQPSQKYYYDLHKLFIGKTKDETGDAAIEEFVRLKPKMY